MIFSFFHHICHPHYIFLKRNIFVDPAHTFGRGTDLAATLVWRHGGTDDDNDEDEVDDDNDIGDNDDHNYDMIVIGIDISPTKYQNMMNTNL